MKNDPKLSNYLAKQQLKDKRAARAKTDNKVFLLGATGALALALLSQLAYFGFGPGSQVAEPETVAEATQTPTEEPTVEPTNDPLVPSPDISEYRSWAGSMQLNGQELAFELDGAAAPQAVANFVSLAQSGFYENVTCHRLTTAGIFVLQCGDPDGNGTGGPGYNWGPIENAPADSTYAEGVIAMARVGGNDYSMGSQFFIVYDESMIPSDAVGGYTIFGKVTSGIDLVKEIAAKGTDNGGSDGAPLEPVVMSAISVE